MSSIKKTIFILLGLLSLIIGFIGVFVPGLPTTPFVLLSSWFFIRSNKRLYKWLLTSFMGRYIRNYVRGGGMTIKAKIIAIVTMCTMITISLLLFISNPDVKLIVCIAGVIGVLSIIFIVPLAKTIPNTTLYNTSSQDITLSTSLSTRSKPLNEPSFDSCKSE